jgi:membrane associated rhomboid family serine protease
MSNQYRPMGFRVLPTVVKNLLIINILVFLLQIVSPQLFGFRLEDALGLHYFGASDFRPWQFITYMFLHGNFSHILFNMFALWMFGYMLENVWGPKKFLIYYLITGVGAAAFHYIVFYIEVSPLLSSINDIISNPDADKIFALIEAHKFRINQYSGEIYYQFKNFQNAVYALDKNPTDREAIQESINFLTDYKEYYLNAQNVIGASGAVFGILVAFGMMFPNLPIYLYFLIPIKAKWVVIGYGALELFLGFSGSDSNVAHFAHLGGMIIGFFIILYWKRKGRLF